MIIYLYQVRLVFTTNIQISEFIRHALYINLFLIMITELKIPKSRLNYNRHAVSDGEPKIKAVDSNHDCN